MLANVKMMRNVDFTDRIQDILKSGNYSVAQDDDEFFGISPVDQAIYKYYQEDSNGKGPVLPIRYDALSSSIPSRSLIRSYSTTDASDKITEFNALTVINFAGMTDWDAYLSPSAPKKWPFARWIHKAYMKYYISDVKFPGIIQDAECCDDPCCPPDCECRKNPGWCALTPHKWINFGKIKARICIRLQSTR
jgi:hypothetical protein